MHPEIILGCYFFLAPRLYYREQFDPGLKNRKLFEGVPHVRTLNSSPSSTLSNYSVIPYSVTVFSITGQSVTVGSVTHYRMTNFQKTG